MNRVMITYPSRGGGSLIVLANVMLTSLLKRLLSIRLDPQLKNGVG